MHVGMLPFFHNLTSAIHDAFVMYQNIPLPGTTESPKGIHSESHVYLPSPTVRNEHTYAYSVPEAICSYVI